MSPRKVVLLAGQVGSACAQANARDLQIGRQVAIPFDQVGAELPARTESNARSRQTGRFQPGTMPSDGGGEQQSARLGFERQLGGRRPLQAQRREFFACVRPGLSLFMFCRC